MKKKSLPIILTDNRDITISWLFVWARYNSSLTIHQIRLILRIIEYCQKELNGIKIKDNLRQLEYQRDDVLLRMPVSDVYFSDFTLDDIKSDLGNLRDRRIEFYDKPNRIWNACGIIEKPYVFEGTGIMEFKIDLKFWKILLNMAHGIRKCELNKALALPTFNAIWFYILISEKKEPFRITIPHLKERLGISPDDYKRADGKDRIDNLEARVILPAQKALKESCPYTFEYEKIRKNPKNERSPVRLLVFKPVYQPDYRDKDLAKKSAIAKTSVSLINQEVYDYMMQTMGFELKELQSNKMLIAEATEIMPHFLEKLRDIQNRRRLQNKEKGWIINAIRSEVEEVKKDLSTNSATVPTQSYSTGYIADLFDANL